LLKIILFSFEQGFVLFLAFNLWRLHTQSSIKLGFIFLGISRYIAWKHSLPNFINFVAWWKFLLWIWWLEHGHIWFKLFIIWLVKLTIFKLWITNHWSFTTEWELSLEQMPIIKTFWLTSLLSQNSNFKQFVNPWPTNVNTNKH